MPITVEMIISGFGSMIASDCWDMLKNAIKSADKNRKALNQNIETRIYQVTIDAINAVTYNKYKEQDILYDSAESILKGFKSGGENSEAVKAGLKMLGLQVTGDMCKEFLAAICREICAEENNDLHKAIELFQQKQMSEEMQKGFKEIKQNHEEMLEKLDYVRDKKDDKEFQKIECHKESYIENRVEEYAGRWDKNVFLNDFDEEDENPGAEIKLRDIYREECLPHYIWKTNAKPSDKLKQFMKKYITENDDKKMLLVLGQAGIGKSTLITWVTANFKEKKDEILVYQFASDLKDINWQGNDILNDMFETLKLGRDELENKVLILDGFDEVFAGNERERILNQIYHKLKGMNYLKKFSLIITCRENYIAELSRSQCDYITLQPWDEKQIQSFCKTYTMLRGEKQSSFSQNTNDKILENKEVFGIPLILYMVLALNISVGENSTMVDIYDQIFSLDAGGIYDRCIKNASYGGEHRISKIKRQIHRISQNIAFWIFENNSEEAFIPKGEYEKICDTVISEMEEKDEDIKRDFLIGNYFKLTKHCEGIGTEELQFVHRSIYEYFVTVYFYESICNLKSKEEAAGKLGMLLKKGYLSKQILEFIKYKFDRMKRYCLPDITREIFQIMLQDGMTHHAKEKYKNVVVREMNIFSNMLKIVFIWNGALRKLNDNVIHYLHYNHLISLNLQGIELEGAYLSGVGLGGANLSRADLREADLGGANLIGADLREVKLSKADLRKADLIGAHLEGANLIGADLSRTNLSRANLIGANLTGANLREADLSEANLMEADLRGAYLSGATFDEKQVEELEEDYDLSGSMVYISETKELISYKEYRIRNQKE